MSEQARHFGATPDGRPATLLTLGAGALRAHVTDFGGRLVSLEVAVDRNEPRGVVIGFDDVGPYARQGSFGALLGRVANRIGGGAFALNGKTYELSRNDGRNTLHGGKDGFGKQFWSVLSSNSTRVVLEYISPDGDQGFPGTLTAHAVYEVSDLALTLTLEARTDTPTPVNLSAHPYFNLARE